MFCVFPTSNPKPTREAVVSKVDVIAGDARFEESARDPRLTANEAGGQASAGIEGAAE